ncbi:MAG: hypothetical protein AAFZ11_05850 [Pseudomonadota bacterium]
MQDFGALTQDAGQAYAVTYYAHAAIGFGAAGMALVALFSQKGGAWHRRSGQIFLCAMGFAALSALYFVVARIPAPPVLIGALMSIYAMAMAVLSLKPQTGAWFAAQAASASIPFLIGLFYVSYLAAAIMIPDVPAYVGVLGPVTGILFLVIGWKDVAFLRARNVDRPRRLQRHGFRMALVCTQVVSAPLQSFGPLFLGEEHSFQFYAFAPFLLVPLIVWLATPAWLKTPTPEPKVEPA